MIGMHSKGDIVCDKDGVSAAAVFAEMAVALAKEGKTIQVQVFLFHIFIRDYTMNGVSYALSVDVW